MKSCVSDHAWDERTSASDGSLGDNESMFRQLFERSADAIFLFDAGREVFVDCNQAAVEMMRASSKQQLLMVHPAHLSSEFQPDGKSSREKTSEVINLALSKGSYRFEWRARRMDQTEFPLEVLLTPIQSGEHPLMATVCRDITDRKRDERKILELNSSLEQRVAERTAALRDSEAKFRALFEGSSQGVVLHDENGLREVNPAAVRIMGRQFEHELLGKYPAEMAPPFQPNGETSEVMARKYIDECMTKGSARFEWLACAPDGREIPLEVALTRIEWSGRQMIQAFITDITERKQAERALREANRELHREIEQRTRAEESLQERVRVSTLNAEVAVALNAGTDLPSMLQRCSELMVQHLDVAFVRIWLLNPATQTLELQSSAGCYTHLDGPHSRVKVGEHKIGLIAQEKKPLLTNSVQSDPRVSDKAWAARAGMVAFAGYPLLIEEQVLGVLAMFSRRPLGDDLLTTLGSIADSLALGIERKRAQTALGESEARFSAAFQASPALIGILRMSDGKYVLANDAHLNWLGYPCEEVVGRTCLELGMWENPAERDSVLQDMQAFGSIRQRECRWRNRAGQPFTILLSAETIQLNNAPHMLLIALDITKRKAIEEELRASEARLRESEARFSAAFHSSPIITGICRASDATFVLVNDESLNWSGYSRDEVVGRTSIELDVWENPAERQRLWDDVRRSGSIRAREVRLRNRFGKLSTMLASGAMIEINGEDHLLVMMVEISHRKQAEAELHRTLAREKELSQLKSNFVSMVSHEFRTPLGIIQSSAELLRDFHGKMQPDEREEQLKSISRNTRRMAGMMEEVLVLSRLDAGKLIFEPAALDLNVFFRRVVDEVVSATSRRCPIELFLECIPSAAQADERLLGHIFTNLLSNAVKYSEAGATVEFTARRDGSEAVCVVRDRGIGISEIDQQQLFKAFHRGGNVGTRAGTGLGLLLVKRCADLHGGKVQVESRIGEGTTVTVKLPVFGETHEKDIGH
jgi:PAS domain S-box-containing protein